MGDEPPAVVMHGTPFSSIEWRRIAPQLAKHRRAVCYDMLGYGRSDKPDADVSRGVQNGLIAALVEHWEIAQPDVLAHDFGGSTAFLGGRLPQLGLVDRDDMLLVEEVMPLSTQEEAHRHFRARQVFFVLSGTLDIDMGGATVRLMRHEGCEVSPGAVH